MSKKVNQVQLSKSKGAEITDEAIAADNKRQAEKKGTSRTLYFASSNDIRTLIDHLNKYPRANLSSIFGQIVKPLNAEFAKLPKDQRFIDLNVKIWV